MRIDRLAALMGPLMLLLIAATPVRALDPMVTLDNGSTGYLVSIEEAPFAERGELEVTYDFDGEKPADEAAIAAAAEALCARDRAHIVGAALRAYNVEVTRIDMRFRWKTFVEPGTSWSAEAFSRSFGPDCAAVVE